MINAELSPFTRYANAASGQAFVRVEIQVRIEDAALVRAGATAWPNENTLSGCMADEGSGFPVAKNLKRGDGAGDD